MPKITYFEYRPGRWVKMVDGQAVGPAKPEEVVQWQREQAAQDKIWRDVVHEAAPSQPERKAPPKRRGTSTTPEDEAAIWQDVVKKADAAPEADRGKPAPAEPASIWQDVVQRLASAPSPPKLQPQEMPPPEKPAPPLTLAEAMEAAQRGEAIVIRSGKVARPVDKLSRIRPPEPVASSPAETAPAQHAPVEPEKENLSQAKIEPMRKRPTQPEPTPQAAPPKPTPEAKAPAKQGTPKPVGKPTPKAEVSAKEGTPKPVAKPAPEAKAPAKDGTPKPVAKPKPTPKPARPPRSSKATATKETAKVEAEPPAESAARERKPRIRATPTKTPIEPEPAPGLQPEPGEEAAELEQEVPADSPPPEVRAKPAPKHRATTAAKRAGKPPTTALEEEAGPSYLWIVAAPTDDLLAAIRSGLAKYQERFGEAAGAVLCHSEDLPGLEGARLPVDVREGRTLPRRNFWIGPK